MEPEFETARAIGLDVVDHQQRRGFPEDQASAVAACVNQKRAPCAAQYCQSPLASSRAVTFCERAHLRLNDTLRFYGFYRVYYYP
jgi:hypothetical protein